MAPPIIAAFVGVGLWLASSRLIVPGLLGWLHTSAPPVLANRLLPGRGEVPLSAYLDEWWTRLPSLDYVAVTTVLLGAGVWLAVRWVRRTPPSAESKAAEPPGDEPMGTESGGATPAGPTSGGRDPRTRGRRMRRWALVGAGWGAVVGLGEAYHLAAKLFYLRETPARYVVVAPESVWSVILVDGVLLAILGALWAGLAPARRLGPRRDRLFGLTLLGTVGMASLLGLSGRMHAVTVALLAFGLAARSAAVLAPRWDALLPGARRAAGVGLAAAVVIAGGQRVLEGLRDRGRAADAPSDLRPNVILIVLDTERAQNWRLYGASRATTDEMERWAARGVVFDRALAPSNWTLPSHASLFTSRPVWELGVDWSTPLPPSRTTLAEFLGERGYRTGGFVGNLYFLGTHFGLDQGFQRWDDHRPTIAYALTSSWIVREVHEGLRALLGLSPPSLEKSAPEVTEAFLAWLDEDRPRPFFAMLNLIDAHTPYAPPDEARRYSSPGDPFWLSEGSEADAYPTEDIQALENAYDDEIALLDRSVGRLFADLERRGALDNTLVVVTSDHGESFGENGWMDHDTRNVHRTLLHVPLVIFGPGLPRGRRIAEPVSLSRIPATVAAFTGFADHPFAGSPLLDVAGVTTRSEPAFSAFDGRFSVVDGDFHYLRIGGDEELYHWLEDPWEENDLASSAAYAATLDRMRTLLEERVGDSALLPPRPWGRRPNGVSRAAPPASSGPSPGRSP